MMEGIMMEGTKKRRDILGLRKLMIRDSVSYREIDPIIVADANGWRVSNNYAFDNLQELLTFSKLLDPTKQEVYSDVFLP
jgi:hypothetical protein